MCKRIILLGCLCVSGGVYAAAEQPHNIWLSYSQDENETRSLDAVLTLSLSPDDLLLLGAGQTDIRVLNLLTDEYETATTYNFSVLYSTLRSAPWSIDLGYDFWGKNQELEINTFKLGTAWHGEQWTLGINLEQSSIAVYTLELEILGGVREYTVDSTGAGPRLELRADDWFWSLTGLYYDYSKDVSRLSRLNTLLGDYLFGPRTFLHTTALAQWYATSKLKYYFTALSVGGKYSHTVLAIDQSATDSVSMLFDFTLSQRVSLDLEVGRVFTADDNDVNFASVGMSVDF